MDNLTRKVHPKSNPSNPGTEHLVADKNSNPTILHGEIAKRLLLALLKQLDDPLNAADLSDEGIGIFQRQLGQLSATG